MIRDEIENKIQLETINVNKTITNKRRRIGSKERINWKTSMNFCMASIQFKKEREGKERKKSNSRPKHAETPYTGQL